MKITELAGGRAFLFSAKNFSYLLGIAKNDRLVNLYWGAELPADDAECIAKRLLNQEDGQDGVASVPPLDDELPTLEPMDFTQPVLLAEQPDGVRSLRLRYASHKIDHEKLVVTLLDECYPFKVEAHYRGWKNLPLLSRKLILTNQSSSPIILRSVKSAAWYPPRGEDYRLTHLAGHWGAEYTKNSLMLTQARTVLQNNRFTCGAAQQVPFFALDRNGEATETSGEVYFGVLHWSGDFSITVESQFGKRVSVVGGISDFDCEYSLKPGESFETPEMTAGFADGGFGRMSEILYDWQYDHLLPRGSDGKKPYAERPVIYNSWYPYEFGVNEANCLALIDRCAELGVDLFVIDDGWMPGRENDHAGLGDWTHDGKRFPRGLRSVSDACHAKGMQFGLWVEPEMVNPDSELYRSHPDWVIHDPTRARTEQRHQLVLNLAMDEVYDWAIGMLDQIIEEYRLDYLKWDMNRYISEKGWPQATPQEQRSLAIRYTKNLLRIWRHLNERHPDVLFENCASGGGRSDFGMVPYADRINRSDNADPVDVMRIHEGFTMLFVPKAAGGAGNIAPERHPVHNRPTTLPFRICWGMTGSMSIGINLLKSDQAELEELKKAIRDFKRIRSDLQNAYVYRIASAYEHPYALFEYVRRDRRVFTLFAFAHGMRLSDTKLPLFRMRGLIPEAIYTSEDGTRMSGAALMRYGIQIKLKGDCDSVRCTWKAV